MEEREEKRYWWSKSEKREEQRWGKEEKKGIKKKKGKDSSRERMRMDGRGSDSIREYTWSMLKGGHKKTSLKVICV